MITCNAPDAASNFPTEAGDIIEIYNRAMEVVQTYTVTSVSGYGLVYEITVNKRVKEVEEGYLVGNLTRTPALTVDNCVFRNKRQSRHPLSDAEFEHPKLYFLQCDSRFRQSA